MHVLPTNLYIQCFVKLVHFFEIPSPCICLCSTLGGGGGQDNGGYHEHTGGTQFIWENREYTEEYHDKCGEDH